MTELTWAEKLGRFSLQYFMQLESQFQKLNVFRRKPAEYCSSKLQEGRGHWNLSFLREMPLLICFVVFASLQKSKKSAKVCQKYTCSGSFQRLLISVVLYVPISFVKSSNPSFNTPLKLTAYLWWGRISTNHINLIQFVGLANKIAVIRKLVKMG